MEVVGVECVGVEWGVGVVKMLSILILRDRSLYTYLSEAKKTTAGHAREKERLLTSFR